MLFEGISDVLVYENQDHMTVSYESPLSKKNKIFEPLVSISNYQADIV